MDAIENDQEEEAIALGFPSASAAREHAAWLAKNGTQEYKAWLASIKTRADFEKKYGQVWSSQELLKDFSLVDFIAPFVVVERKSDKARGSLVFSRSPRFYFSFTEDQDKK